MGYIGATPTAVPLTGADILDDSIESADIKAGTIVNSDINTSAAIAQSKLVDIVNADIAAGAAIVTSKVSGAVTSIASHGLATSATTDTTNAANITTGTVADARISASSVTQHVATQIGFSNVSSWADSAVETLTLSTAASAMGKAQVAVYEEIPDVNKTNASWDISTNDTGFDLIDSAYAQTLTPAATTGDSIAFTMGGGSWVAADIGKRIVNVSTSEAGVAKIVSIASTVATCIITTTFTDTNAIASGDWELYAGEFTEGAFSLANATVSGNIGVTPEYVNTGATIYTPAVIKLTATTAILVYGLSSVSKARHVTVSNGNIVSFGTEVQIHTSDTGYCRGSRISDTQIICFVKEYVKVLTVSGTTISVGTAVSVGSPAWADITMLTTTTGVLTFRDNAASSTGSTRPFTISGTTITLGTKVTYFSGGNASYNKVTRLSDTKAIVAYQYLSNSVQCCILDVVSNVVTAGTPQIITGIHQDSQPTIEGITSTTALLAGNDEKIVVLSISGTTITIGTIVAFTTVSTSNVNLSAHPDGTFALTYIDSTVWNNKFSVYTKVTVSGTTVSVGDLTTISGPLLSLNRLDSATLSNTLILVSEVPVNAGSVRVIDLDAPYTQSTAFTVYQAGNTNGRDVVGMTATQGLVVFRDSVSYDGTAFVVNKADGSVTTTFGAELAWESNQSDQPNVARLSDTTALVIYKDATDQYGYARVLTISSNVVTTGSRVGFTGTTVPTYLDVCTLSATLGIAVYHGGTANGEAVVLTVSGTSVTAGTAFEFESGQASGIDVTQLTSTTAIVTYQDVNNTDNGTAIVLTVSGTTITGGTPFVFDTGSYHWGEVVTVSSTKAAVVYRAATGYPTICILSISGTTITGGTPVTISSTSSYYPRLTAVSATEVLATFDEGDGKYCFITISGTVATIGTIYRATVGNPDDGMDIAYLDENNFLLNLRDSNNSTYGSVGSIIKLTQPLYVSSQYVTTISGTDSVDTTYYSDWNSNTITETLGGQSAYYAFSVNSTPSAAEVTGGTFMVIGTSQTATRNIVSSLNSVHGGTAGVWYKNTNATYGSATWVAATTNEAKAAIQEATATAANQMTGTAFAAISDANLPAFGTQMSVAMTLYSTDNTVSPSIAGVSFNYDGNVINRLETDAYTVEMPSTGSIKITAPGSGGPRNARVYVSG